MNAPEKIVRGFAFGRRLERHDAQTERIDVVKNTANRAVLAACIHALKNEQDALRALCVQLLLQLIERGIQLAQTHAILIFRSQRKRLRRGIDGSKIKPLELLDFEIRHAIIVEIGFFGHARSRLKKTKGCCQTGPAATPEYSSRQLKRIISSSKAL